MASSEQRVSNTQLDNQLVCPDPSVHENFDQQKRLQEQSANVALHVSHPGRATNVRGINLLGPDGKLSSAGNHSLTWRMANSLNERSNVDTMNQEPLHL
jgi:hypothetical protein